MPTKHLLISGKVQGVFYRASAMDIAVELNISGWIRNTAEGHVEVLITGEESSLHKFINWCSSGPEKAEVDQVEVSDMEDQYLNGFKIIK